MTWCLPGARTWKQLESWADWTNTIDVDVVVLSFMTVRVLKVSFLFDQNSIL